MSTITIKDIIEFCSATGMKPCCRDNFRLAWELLELARLDEEEVEALLRIDD